MAMFITVTNWICYIIIVIGFINNSLVLVTLLKKRDWRKKANFVYLVLMAICDPPSGLVQSGHLLAFLVDKDCTDIVGFAILSRMNTYPVWLLVAMVTERTIAIINPLKARNLFSVKSNIIESSCIFILLLLFAVLPVTLDAY